MSAPQVVMMWLAAYSLVGFAVRALFISAVGDGSERSARISNVIGVFWPMLLFWFGFAAFGRKS